MLLEDYYFGDDDALELPTLRIYGTTEQQISLDAEDIISNACEDLHEDAGRNCDKEELQKILDNWCEAQSCTETYYPDFNVGVIFVGKP